MEYLKFTVDSALLRELGEKLVETVHLALAELIKNAYDADATTVTIRFTQGKGNKDEIHIIDNGVGMNFREVKDYWMRIATTNKLGHHISRRYGRPKTGAKGIGRFCCRRLGDELKLITTGIENSNGEQELQKSEANFYWDQFKPGTDVTEVSCPGKQTIEEHTQTGTILIIRDLKKEWNIKGFHWLKRQLALLAANRGTRRSGYEEDPGFNITLEAPDLEGGIIDIRDSLINGGWGTLTAYINNKHQAVCQLDAMDIGRKTIISSKEFPHLQDVRLNLGILVENRVQMRDTSILSQGSLKDILPGWGGVHVSFHGFRVYPYGDDDWLGIDRDRGLRKRIPPDELRMFAQGLHGINPDRVLLSMLSMRSYVGNVEIGGNAGGFEMKANREGFIESPAFEELKAFTRFAIDWSTIYRDYYLRTKAREDVETAREHLQEITGEDIEEGKIVWGAVNYIQKEVENISSYLPEAEKISFKKSVSDAVQLILKETQATQKELMHLRLIASTSTLLLIFSHEVKSLLGLLESSKNRMQIIGEKLPGKERGELQETWENFAELKSRLQELLEMTSLVGLDKRSDRPMQLALHERILRAVKIFQLIISKYDIDVDYKRIPQDIVTRSIAEAELYAVLLNVLSNSIKAVIAVGGDKKIEITAERAPGKTILNIRDTGVGLHPSHYEEVFTPFISDPAGEFYRHLEKHLNPEDRYIVGSGSGLGLSIAREILDTRGGSIAFKKPSGNWKCELEIILP